MNKVHDFSVEKPIDIKKAVEALGGEEKIFYSMLGKLEKMSLNPTMINLADAINERDFE